jgi:hypothetical protein
MQVAQPPLHIACVQNINKSLSALGDVIAAIAGKDKHVPFRYLCIMRCLGTPPPTLCYTLSACMGLAFNAQALHPQATLNHDTSAHNIAILSLAGTASLRICYKPAWAAMLRR